MPSHGGHVYLHLYQSFMTDVMLDPQKSQLNLAPLFLVGSTRYGGYTVAQLVEALRYKPEGRGFDSRWCH